MAIANALEGTLAQATGTYGDADGDVVVLSASEGSIEKTSGTSAGTWRWTEPAPDGPLTSTVVVTATDGSSAPVTAQFDLQVQNHAPWTWTTGPALVPAHSKSSRYFKWSATDVPADTVSSVVSCGAGTELARGATIIDGVNWVRCSFDVPGTTLVGVSASDEDGGSVDGRIPTLATPQVKSVADAQLVIDGASGTENMGGALAMTDLNGDGRADLAVGSQSSNTSPLQPGPGYVAIIMGGTDASSVDLGSVGTGKGYRIIGAQPGEQLGWSLAAAGDINGDGRQDLIVGAPSAAPFGRAYAGAAYVIYGSTATTDLDLASLPVTRGFMIAGSAQGNHAGMAVAGIGDMNGDGYADVAVGSPDADPQGRDTAGTMNIVLGGPSLGNIDLQNPPAAAGTSVIGAQLIELGGVIAGGDVNGDHFSDVIVSSAHFPNKVWAIYGSSSPHAVDTASFQSADGFTISANGSGSNARFGAALATGDVDGDGFADVLIGAPGWNLGSAATLDTGAVFIVRGAKTTSDIADVGTTGGPLIFRYRGDQRKDGAGSSLATGDWNGDGLSDVVIGAHPSSNNDELSGSAYLVAGTAALKDLDLGVLADGWQRIDGDSGAAYAGRAVAVGDFSGDGVDDVSIGAPSYYLGVPGRASVFVSNPVDGPPPVDSAPPVGSVVINAGAALTGDSTVALSISATDASGVQSVSISNNGTTWVTRPYVDATGWSLTDPASGGSITNGERTVYVRWTDIVGNLSPVAIDTVILDTVAPSATGPTKGFVPGSSLSTGKPSVRFSWSGSDATSGIDHYELALSTDAGAYSTLSGALASPTLTRTLAAGHAYRARVRAIDPAGNVGAWAYGASFRLTAYQESSRSIRWTGTWHSGSSTGYWGGHDRYATASGARASLTFRGRSFAWVGSVGPTRGWARVYVNGILIRSINLNATTSANRRVLFATSWSTAVSRTVTIRINGTAGHPRGDVDAFLTGS
jgi:FG-GAP repeat protein